MIANSVDQLLQIHSRFPVLAFLLSLCNPSTISLTLDFPAEVSIRSLKSTRSANLKGLLSHRLSIPLPGLRRFDISLLCFHDIVLHLLVAGAGSLVFFNTLQLGFRGVRYVMSSRIIPVLCPYIGRQGFSFDN